jgi:hypothetical protein
MIAVDWSHRKGLMTYDGKKLRVEDTKSFITRLSMVKYEYADKAAHKSKQTTIIIEQGCPLSLMYKVLKAGINVKQISNRATEDYRKKHGIDKSDENDARIIYELAQQKVKLTPITLGDNLLRLHDLYHQYCRYQKARVAMMNMKKGHLRQYGESDMQPYDSGIDTLETKEKGLLKELEKLVPEIPQTLHIKGLGKRIWAGIFVTANPSNFKCLSAYLRFCGLVNPNSLNNKYNRHARMLYHMLAEQVVRQSDPEFRPLYDKIKADIVKRYPDYTKLHIHNAALNRTATFLAKAIYKHCHMKPM